MNFLELSDFMTISRDELDLGHETFSLYLHFWEKPFEDSMELVKVLPTRVDINVSIVIPTLCRHMNRR